MFNPVIITNLTELKEKVNNEKNLVLIPTMGALHDGHLSLLKTASNHSENYIVTIFVNPKQFSANEDLHKYPKEIKSDIEKLSKAGCKIIFVPDIKEIYPKNFSTYLTNKSKTNILCGKSRVGHFDGVLTIILKLFLLIKPIYAVFGEKDFQQLFLIKQMVKDFNLDIKIIASPIIREKNNLAMSSRNKFLSFHDKERASNLFLTMHNSRQELQTLRDWRIVKKKALQVLQDFALKVDYFELVNEENLEITCNYSSIQQQRILAAVYINNTRIIDNIAV